MRTDQKRRLKALEAAKVACDGEGRVSWDAIEWLDRDYGAQVGWNLEARIRDASPDTSIVVVIVDFLEAARKFDQNVVSKFFEFRDNQPGLDHQDQRRDAAQPEEIHQ